MFVNSVRKVLSLKLGREMVLSQMWEKKFQSPWRSNLRPSDSALRHTTTLVIIILHLPLFLSELKTYHLLYYIYKHDTINIGHLSSMQDVCHNHMNFVMSLALEFLWLSGKASEHRVCTIYLLFKGNGSQIEVDCGSGQWPFLQYVVSSYNPWRYNFLRNLMSIKVCTRSQHQRKTPLLWMTALTSFCLKKNLEQMTHGELNLYFLNSKSACFAVLLGANILIFMYLKVYFIHRTTFSSEQIPQVATF